MKQQMKLYAILSQKAIQNMKGNRGRMTTQAGHGFVHALWDSMDRFPLAFEQYKNQKSAFKITLVCNDETILLNLLEKYRSICGVSLVQETGSKMNGEVNEKVVDITCLGLGPLSADLIGDDISSLKPFM